MPPGREADLFGLLPPNPPNPAAKRRRSGRRFLVKAHRLVYHSTLGWRVTKKKKKSKRLFWPLKWLRTSVTKSIIA
jgi:hypothetical protein